MGYPAPAAGGLASTCEAILASGATAALWAGTHNRGGPGPTYAPDVANDEDKAILVRNGTSSAYGGPGPGDPGKCPWRQPVATGTGRDVRFCR